MLPIPLSVLHVLRLTGLGICFLHFASLLSMTRAVRAEGGGAAELLLSISTSSLGLVVGIMLVLLSLLLQSIPAEMEDGSIGYRLPTFYVISRPLILLIAIAYLAIIPSQLMASQKLRQAGMIKLERLVGLQRELITRMATLNSKPGGVEAANKILDHYQIAYNISLPARPSSAEQLEIVLEKLSRQLELDKIRRIRSADSHLSAKSLIVLVSSAVTGVILLFYWFLWPRKVRLQVILSDPTAT